MNAIERRPPEDTRARILDAAWLLFRELGARATIADVASRLGMSSANVYRFFASKQALCEAVATQQLGTAIAVARDIATAEVPASERLRAILVTLFECMRDQTIHEARVHEIVDIAIRERWAPIEAYEMQVAEILAGLIAEGQAGGEFGPGDPNELARLTLCACCGIHHPLLIAVYSGPDAKVPPVSIVEFALRALSNGAGQHGVERHESVSSRGAAGGGSPAGGV